MKRFKFNFKIKSKTICRIVAGILIVTGFIFIGNGFRQTGYSFKNFLASRVKLAAQQVDEPFDSVEIIESNCRVEVYFRDIEKGMVEYPEKGASNQSVSVKNSRLTVKVNDDRTLFEKLKIGIEKPKVIVYIPASYNLELLSVKTTSGVIHIYHNSECSVRNMELTSKSGDIYSDCLASGDISLKSERGLLSISNARPQNVNATTKSGNVTLAELEIEKACVAKTDSGKLKINIVRAHTIETENRKGQNELYSALADELLSVRSEKGNIQLSACDGKLIKVQNGSGSIRGTIRSERSYNVSTSFGNVLIPANSMGGICELSTVSGDIEITRSELSDRENTETVLR